MGERLIKRGAEPKLLGFLVLQQSLFFAAGIGLWLWSGAALADFLRPTWQALGLGIGPAAGLMALLALCFLPQPGLLERIVREQGKGVFSTERPWGLGGILIISASAGIGEEALFRGGLQTFLGGLLPAWAAILLTTILFAVAHPGSRLFMGFIAAVSLAFSLAYHWSGSLFAVMLAHALFDVFGCLWVQRELRRLGHWDSEAAP
jgi:hypothetical protein